MQGIRALSPSPTVTFSAGPSINYWRVYKLNIDDGMDSTATSQISGKSFEKSMLVGAEVFFVWLKKKKSRANTTHKLVLHVASTPPNERRAKLSTGERERAQSIRLAFSASSSQLRLTQVGIEPSRTGMYKRGDRFARYELVIVNPSKNRMRKPVVRTDAARHYSAGHRLMLLIV